MGKLVVVENLTLDGVMQAPGAVEEDTRDGFRRGGWATTPDQDGVVAQKMGEGMARSEALLFGRWTYESFYSYWPHQTDNPYTDVLDKTVKYVASTTLAEPLPWQNSTLLKGDAMRAVAEVKQRVDGDLVVLGSGVLTTSLMRHGLVDEYTLVVHPVVLGEGRRLFEDGPDGAAPQSLHLIESVAAGSGVIVTRYQAERT